MKILILLLIPFLILPAFAESQTVSTDKGTLDIKLTYDKLETDMLSKINIDFINPTTQKIQEHIDYTTTVTKDGEYIFGPIPLTHTSKGSVTIPVVFNASDGAYEMNFEVMGILFTPIDTEKATVTLSIGESTDMKDDPVEPPKDGGGCLIATAAHGTEMAPQIQSLREIRDGIVLSTESGKSFMSGFNQIYYSFSPQIADWERENPAFKKIVKVFITPMLSTLSILNYANIDSEQEMITFGAGIILLNIGMYVGIPVLGVMGLRQFRK